MPYDIQKIWLEFAKGNLPSEKPWLRRGSRSKIASPWVNGVSTPAMPTRKLSNVIVYEHGWLNNSNMALAKKIVLDNPNITLRELVDEMLLKMEKLETSFPYVWWVVPEGNKTRTIYEDANGITFVKLDNKWNIVYSSEAVGVLVGAQGSQDYEGIPRNSYFVSWENETIAMQY